jgi:hypothetical protein
VGELGPGPHGPEPFEVDPMPGVRHQSDLDRTLASEVLGEIVFEAAARCTRAPERREKWLRLLALETQTRRRLLDYLEAHGEHARPPRLARLTGWVVGATLGLLPWSLAMRTLERATRGYLETFERLARNAAGSDGGFFSYVVAHERAIAEFARRELSGRAAVSLEPVTRLLAAPPGETPAGADPPRERLA